MEAEEEAEEEFDYLLLVQVQAVEAYLSEMVAVLVVEEERVICTFSEWDGSSKLVVYDKSYVDNLIKYT